MPSTNGHGPKRAVLYARVSTDEQARSGYSLAQQMEALREYAAREGYEVLEEVFDRGQSGASLERPGMDRVRDLVAAGGVSVVLAQDRDRFAREPAYHYLLRKEFEEHGTAIRALGDRGDDSPEGELADGVLDQLAKYQRASIARATSRGKLRKVREGRILRGPKPPYGFRYNATQDGLVVYEPEMLVVEKVFRMAVSGLKPGSIQTRLYAEGVPSPTGKDMWQRQVIRRIVDNDIYLPYAHDEIGDLVSPEVAAKLDPAQSYALWWFGRHEVTAKTISEPDGNGGKRYMKREIRRPRPREQQIAVPVPAYLPRALVETARATLAASKGTERKYLAREWELRGLLRCSCDGKMSTQTTKPRGGDITYYYYTCNRRRKLRKMRGCEQKSLSALEVEAQVWELVSGLLKDPERIRAGMNRLIEEERTRGRAGDPEREARALADSMAESDRLRAAYQDQQAAGYMTLTELGTKLRELETTRRVAQAELEHLLAHKERVEELEQDRDFLLESYAEMVPDALDDLSGEERNRLYGMLRLEVMPASEGLEVSGAFCTSELPSTAT